MPKSWIMIVLTLIALPILTGSNRVTAEAMSPVEGAPDPALAVHIREELAELKYRLRESPFSRSELLARIAEDVFNAYLMAESEARDFEQRIEEFANGAGPHFLTSAAYGRLLAIRAYVDSAREEMNLIRLEAIIRIADPDGLPGAKEEARVVLGETARILRGVRADGRELEKGVRSWLVSYLLDSQSELEIALKALENERTRSARERAILSSSRRALSQLGSDGTEPDSATFARELEQVRDTPLFRALAKKLHAEGRKLSNNFQLLAAQSHRGFVPDRIRPGTGSEGNINGNEFPAHTWSLTFDDGPDGTSPEVLRNLTQLGIKATFFMLARQVLAFPATAQSIVDAGHDLACHSWNHVNLTASTSGPATREHEIGAATAELERKFGRDIKFFRLPYGNGWNVHRVRAKIAEHGMVHVFWNVDTLDWKYKDANRIFELSKRQIDANGKGIVLFHDIHDQTVVASRRVMDYLNSRGKRLCTIQAVVDQLNSGGSDCR